MVILTLTRRQLSRTRHRVLLNWMLKEPFQAQSTFMGFSTFFYPKDSEILDPGLFFSPEIPVSIAAT
jgi:hypothetical protein